MDLTTNHYIMIGLAILSIIFLVSWLISLSRKNKIQEELTLKHSKQTSDLKATYEEEKASIINQKDEELKSKEAYFNEETRKQNIKINSLKGLSRDGGEYLTDLSLIQLKERLVRNERIRPEDMHVLANIFLPGRDLKRTSRIMHVVLTRTGIYMLESHYWKGHIYHGVEQADFSVEPMFQHVFSLLELDPYVEQTLAMERDEEKGAVYFKSLKGDIESLKERAKSFEETFNLQYPVTPIFYFNKEGHDSGTINNYSRDKQVKVLVGEDELESFFEKYVFHGRFEYTVEELQKLRDAIEHLNP